MNVIKPRKAPREPEASLIAVKKKPGPSTGGGSNSNNNNSSSRNSSPKAPNLKKNRDEIQHISNFPSTFNVAVQKPHFMDIGHRYTAG